VLAYNEIKKIRDLYSKNKNVSRYLRNKKGESENSIETILYSYDLQGGNDYLRRNDSLIGLNNKKMSERISRAISELGAKSFLEAGTGEGLILGLLDSNKIKNRPEIFGFDLSLSRLLFAQKYLTEKKRKKGNLFCANMVNIPLPDNSVDIVCTVMSMEPNHGREKQILSELFRVARRYLILIEPTYELGSKQTKKHIIQHGYVRDLPKHIAKLGYRIITHEYLGFSHSNNENALIIAEKKKNLPMTRNISFVSPLSNKSLKKYENYWYCKEDGYAYPIINGIPCLIKENAILASQIHRFWK
jgi:uncharacterized protein YbaR (Trm112 family)